MKQEEYFNDSLPAPFSKGPMAHVITIDLGQWAAAGALRFSHLLGPSAPKGTAWRNRMNGSWFQNIQKSTEIHGSGVKYPNCPNLVYSPFLPLFGIMIPNDAYFSGLSEAWPEQRRRTAAAIRLGTCAGRCHGCHRHLSIVFLLDFRGDLLLRLCDLCWRHERELNNLTAKGGKLGLSIFRGPDRSKRYPFLDLFALHMSDWCAAWMLNSVEIHLAQGHPKREAEWHEETEKTRKPHHTTLVTSVDLSWEFGATFVSGGLDSWDHTRSNFRTWGAMAEKCLLKLSRCLKMSQDVSSLLEIGMTMCLWEATRHSHQYSLYVQCPFAFDARSRSESALRKSLY